MKPINEIKALVSDASIDNLADTIREKYWCNEPTYGDFENTAIHSAIEVRSILLPEIEERDSKIEDLKSYYEEKIEVMDRCYQREEADCIYYKHQLSAHETAWKELEQELSKIMKASYIERIGLKVTIMHVQQKLTSLKPKG